MSNFYITRNYVWSLQRYCKELCSDAGHKHIEDSQHAQSNEPVPLEILAPCVEVIEQSPAGFWGYCRYSFDERSQMLDHAVLYSENLEQALGTIIRFSSVVTNALEYRLQKNPDGSLDAWVRLLPKSSKVAQFIRQISMGTGALYLAEVLQSLGVDDISEAYLTTHENLRDRVATQNVVASFEEGGAVQRLHFARDLTSKNLPNHDHRLHRILIRELEKQMADFPEVTNFSELVERFVGQRLVSGVDLNMVCDHFMKSRRTLSRQLQREGTSFLEIRDNIRRERALELIERPGIPLKRIASLCGFNSLSAFTQAFFIWTGGAPTDYRNRDKS